MMRPAPAVVGQVSPAPPAGFFTRWQASTGLLLLAGAMIWRVQSVTVDSRRDALPSVVVEILAWALAVLSLRDHLGRIRLSEPGMWVLGWIAYYFVVPAITWLGGSHFALEALAGLPLDAEMVSKIQYLHVAFIAVFVLVYRLVAPRFSFVPVSLTDIKKHFPLITPLVLVGLLPSLTEIAVRLVTSGTLRPTQGYGDAWIDIASNNSNSRNAGGGDYFYTQVLVKIWFIPLMCLGLGYGMIYARLLLEKRWGTLALFHLQFPILLYLGSGSRSAVATPVLIAFIVADYLYGALPWRYLLVVMALGTAFFNFYAFFRGYQTEDIDTAVTQSLDAQDADVDADSDRTEGGAMLVKEAYAISWAESTGTERGLDYYTESVLSLLPLQVMPEKAEFFSTANMLSREMLGRAAAYSGVAGAILGDGYIAGREPGVVILAGVLGLVFGILVRVLVRAAPGQTGPPFWRVALLACFAGQTVSVIRGDLSIVLTQILFNVAIPSAIVVFVVGKQESGWRYPIRLG